MRNLNLLIALIISINVSGIIAQKRLVPTEKETPKESFSYLKTLNVNESTAIKYDEASCTIINKSNKEMPKGHPLRDEVIEGDYFRETQIMMKFKMDKNQDKTYWLESLDLGDPAYSDPGFIIYDAETGKELYSVSATTIIIPGNGKVYVANKNNVWHSSYKKYTFKNNKLQEVKQPFYYLGVKSTTQKALRLFVDKQLTRQLAYLPANNAVEVLLQADDGKYLIKTSFGLIGWAKLDVWVNAPGEASIKGFEKVGG